MKLANKDRCYVQKLNSDTLENEITYCKWKNHEGKRFISNTKMEVRNWKLNSKKPWVFLNIEGFFVFLHSSCKNQGDQKVTYMNRACESVTIWQRNCRICGNVLEPIGRDYHYSELINPVFTKDKDNVKVKTAVKFIDSQTKAAQISQFELTLHKDGNSKIVKFHKLFFFPYFLLDRAWKIE